jgi:hypothetical protein
VLNATLSNVRPDPLAQGGGALYYREPQEVAKDLFHLTEGWPCLVSDRLFVVGDRLGRLCAHYLDDPDALFAWAAARMRLFWLPPDAPVTIAGSNDRVSPISRREFFLLLHSLVPADRQFISVEALPHYPCMAHTHYLNNPMPKGPTGALDELLSRLNVETAIDREIATAAFVTPGWGGGVGTRPGFLFSTFSGTGQDSGKTETAKLACELWGSALQINDAEGWGSISKALMNDADSGRRCILFDNLATYYANSGIAALLTSNYAWGKVHYVGYRMKPNYYTLYITANTPTLSRDLAVRTVPIFVGPPQGETGWKEWSTSFIRERRWDFIADCLHFLEHAPVTPIKREHRDKWTAWQDGVLAHLPHSTAAAARILELRTRLLGPAGGVSGRRPLRALPSAEPQQTTTARAVTGHSPRSSPPPRGP